MYRNFPLSLSTNAHGPFALTANLDPVDVIEALYSSASFLIASIDISRSATSLRKYSNGSKHSAAKTSHRISSGGRRPPPFQHRVRAQIVVVVQVLVSQRQAENPLPEHRPGRVPATALTVWIVQNPRCLLGQSQHPVRLPQQHRAAVGSDCAAGKRASTSRPLQRGKRTNSGLQSVMGKVSFNIGLPS